MRVYGGMTRAGWKKQKPAGEPWACSKGHQNKGYAVRCLSEGCKEKRQ